MRAVLGSAEETAVKMVLAKETLFVAVVRLSPQLSDCLRLQHHLKRLSHRNFKPLWLQCSRVFNFFGD